jgi:hypothetical protein
MKRTTVVMALGLLLADFAHAEAQTAARVEYRDGRIGVAVAIGDLPQRVYAPRTRDLGWYEVAWRPAPVVVHAGRPHWVRESLNRGELNRVLGSRTVSDIARHGRTLGARGTMRGQWYQAGRRSAVLEVTVGGVLVGEFVDLGADGVIDRFYLAPVPGYHYRYR